MRGSRAVCIKTRLHIVARAAFVMLTLMASVLSALATFSLGVNACTDDNGAMAYVVTVTADAGHPVQFQLRVPFSADAVQLFFDQTGQSSGRSEDLVQIKAYTESGRSLPIDKSPSGYTVQPGGEAFFANYSLKLQPTFLGPSTWIGDHPPSLRWDDYAYIGTDALLQARGFETSPVSVQVRLPANWGLFVSDVGFVAEDGPVSFEHVHKAALLTGRPLVGFQATSSIGRLEFVSAGTLPWSVGALSTSLTTLLEPLQELVPSESTAAHYFIIARYPGALRLNPLISGHIAGDRTLMHWVGVGTIDWWRKHTISDFISLLAQQTLNLAPDASWFSTGLGEYGGLLLLFKAGLLSADEMYQSLHNMYVTGARYSGPAWPTLTLAGTMKPKSRAAGRVLQFRSPVAAFLLDTELRVASAGAVSLLDWWASLAAQQRLQPDAMLFTADLLPTAQLFGGDWSTFTEEHIFGTRVTPPDFDNAFNRWFASLGR